MFDPESHVEVQSIPLTPVLNETKHSVTYVIVYSCGRALSVRLPEVPARFTVLGLSDRVQAYPDICLDSVR